MQLIELINDYSFTLDTVYVWISDIYATIVLNMSLEDTVLTDTINAKVK